jgi:arginase family enzyme
MAYRDAHLVCEKASCSGKLLILEVVELNSFQGAEDRTGRLAVGLLASAPGKTILMNWPILFESAVLAPRRGAAAREAGR